KIVDLLAAQADVVVRYGGGANAGHTLVVGQEKVVFHLVPSGALHARPRCLLGAGMVNDPALLVQELAVMRSRGLLTDVWTRRAVMRSRGLLTDGGVRIAEESHIVLPQHKLVDALRERGPGAIGTTLRGIGPCYEDRAARRGVRALDLADPDRLRARIADNLE